VAANLLGLGAAKEAAQMKRTLLAILSLVAVGCGGDNIYFSDDEGKPRPDVPAFGDHPDELSNPYALGSAIHVDVHHVQASQLAALAVQSDTPAVLRVDQFSVNQDHISVDLTAVGEGMARLQVVDRGGREQHGAGIVVRAPDSARIYAHGPLRVLGRTTASLPSTVVSEARVLAGATGVFAVGYFRGTERVYGHNIANVAPVPQIMVQNQTSGGAPVNEWLFITPSASGTIAIQPNGTQVATLPVIAVAESELQSLTLSEEVTEKKDEKQQIWVYAQLRDGTGRNVYGTYCSWTLDGAAQTSQDNPPQTSGDLYRYEWDQGGARRTLAATCKSQSGTLAIQAGRGWVSNTTYLGCNAAPGGAGAPTLFAILLVALMMWRLRRLRS
jgi:hypothetical protein